MKTFRWLVLCGSVLALALLAAAGYLLYQAGVAQGAAAGAPAGGMTLPSFGTGGLLAGIMAFLLVLFVLRFVIRLIFFPLFAFGVGRRFGGWGHHHRRWDAGSDRPLPPFFKAWHDRAHAENTAGEQPEGDA